MSIIGCQKLVLYGNCIMHENKYLNTDDILF